MLFVVLIIDLLPRGCRTAATGAGVALCDPLAICPVFSFVSNDRPPGAIRLLDPSDPSEIRRSDLFVDEDPSAPEESVLLRSVSYYTLN